MKQRQDWILQQLGISQYELRNPSALKGEFAPQINTNTRLIFVSDTEPCWADPFMADILRSMQLDRSQLDYITPDKLTLLTNLSHICFWFIGTALPAESEQNSAPILASDCWNSLRNDPIAKRQLWQMIYKNEHYFSLEQC